MGRMEAVATRHGGLPPMVRSDLETDRPVKNRTVESHNLRKTTTHFPHGNRILPSSKYEVSR